MTLDRAEALRYLAIARPDAGSLEAIEPVAAALDFMIIEVDLNHLVKLYLSGYSTMKSLPFLLFLYYALEGKHYT